MIEGRAGVILVGGAIVLALVLALEFEGAKFSAGAGFEVVSRRASGKIGAGAVAGAFSALTGGAARSIFAVAEDCDDLGSLVRRVCGGFAGIAGVF